MRQENRRMPERRFAAILSVDVVGYSRLMQRDAPALPGELNTIFRDAGAVVQLAIIASPAASIQLRTDLDGN
jgi:class 3 adenylate cyclase